MPRRSSSSVSSTSGTSESNIVFFAAGGHNHDGSNSSLIDASKYSIFDFDQGFLRTNTERSARQDRNRILFEDTIREIFRTAGVELGENVISAQNIIAGTITANELAANTIVADNIAANTITSNELALNTITAANLSNTITLTSQLVQSGNYIAGTSGWAIYSNGYSEFGNGNFRGNITATGGTFTGKMTAGLTEVGNNIRGATNYAGIALRNDSWENAWVRRSDNTVYFRAGSGTRYIQIDTTTGGTNAIVFPNFSVDNGGNMSASNASISGAISGGTIDIGGSDASSFHVDSSGNIWSGNAAYASAPFRVSSGGAVRASNLTVTGGSLSIGSNNTIFKVNSSGDMWIGHATETSAPFRVINDGSLIATSATISGQINNGGVLIGPSLTFNDGVVSGTTSALRIHNETGSAAVESITNGIYFQDPNSSSIFSKISGNTWLGIARLDINGPRNAHGIPAVQIAQNGIYIQLPRANSGLINTSMALTTSGASIGFTNGPRLSFTDSTATFFGTDVRFRDGTVSSPSFTFSGDTDTGLYKHNNDQLGLAAGGAAGCIVAAGTINTASPSTSSTSGYEYVLRNNTFGTLYRFTSRREYKEEIRLIDEVGDIIDSLRPVTFIPKFIPDKHDDIETEEQRQLRYCDLQYGFIADEVADVAEGKLAQWAWENGELVASGWKWPDMISILTREVQSLRKRISALENNLS